MTATFVFVTILILAAAGVFVWFFVLHRHISTIHAKVDSILHAVLPGGSAATVPAGSKPSAVTIKGSVPLGTVLQGPAKPLT